MSVYVRYCPIALFSAMHRWLGNTAHLVFLFFVVVVLRSLLIAQMNHTYSTVQEEAHLLLIFNRARSIIFVQKVIAGLPGIVNA